MRLAASLPLLLLLSGCAGSGFGSFLGSTFSINGDPNRPDHPAENVQRANGTQPTPTPIPVASGNVWPGPIQPLPSLADIAKTMPEAETGVPTLPPLPQNFPEPAVPRNPSPTQPTPPSAAPAPSGPPATGSPTTSQFQPSVPSGTKVQTSQGLETVSGGTGNFLTLTGPNGAYAGIMVPNGNGTSTIIRPGGAVETVPTPH